MARVDGDAKQPGIVQRRAVDLEGRDDRDLGVGQFGLHRAQAVVAVDQVHPGGGGFQRRPVVIPPGEPEDLGVGVLPGKLAGQMGADKTRDAGDQDPHAPSK